jgi:hypothetical protein
MRYKTAVDKLRTLAGACEVFKRWPPDQPILQAAYTFGDLLSGTDPLESVQVVVVLNLPPEDLPWAAHPASLGWLADDLRLDKGGFAWWWRSQREPLTNPVIRGPVRFWSRQGPDEDVLDALAERRFDALSRVPPSPDASRAQLASDRAAALSHLRAVRDSYWEPSWRRQHRGPNHYPEQDLWEAVEGYLDLHDAAEAPPPAP